MALPVGSGGVHKFCCRSLDHIGSCCMGTAQGKESRDLSYACVALSVKGRGMRAHTHTSVRTHAALEGSQTPVCRKRLVRKCCNTARQFAPSPMP
eukprot:776930-Amphidinium_carterae.1